MRSQSLTRMSRVESRLWAAGAEYGTRRFKVTESDLLEMKENHVYNIPYRCARLACLAIKPSAQASKIILHTKENCAKPAAKLRLDIRCIPLFAREACVHRRRRISYLKVTRICVPIIQFDQIWIKLIEMTCLSFIVNLLDFNIYQNLFLTYLSFWIFNHVLGNLFI